jgi:hypothetical protein
MVGNPHRSASKRKRNATEDSCGKLFGSAGKSLEIKAGRLGLGAAPIRVLV